jgi:hypothetical protein
MGNLTPNDIVTFETENQYQAYHFIDFANVL